MSALSTMYRNHGRNGNTKSAPRIAEGGAKATAIKLAPHVSAGMSVIEELERRMLLSGAHHYVPIAIVGKTVPWSVARFNPNGNSVSKSTAAPDLSIQGPGLNPLQIEQAYGMNKISFGGISGNGAGQTVAIVDYYDDPNALSDINAYSTGFSGFSLPKFNSGAGSPTFTKVNATGGSNLPGTDPNRQNPWSLEESLDIDAVHTMAPMANIILVECDPNTSDLVLDGVNWARKQPGVVAVSQSYGGGEYSSQLQDDNTFTTPAGHLGGAASLGGSKLPGGVTFLASSGDAGAYDTGNSTITPQYPAASANILSVGGTTLTVNGTGPYTYGGESTWGDGTNSGVNGGGGGGISALESQPAYQKGVTDKFSTAHRSYPDISMDADPSSGLYVYDSFDFPGSITSVGGTSLACPLAAGLIAVADQGRAIGGLGSLDGPTQTLPTLYNLAKNAVTYANDFHDIVSGNNGYPALTGYDLATGIGSPIGDRLVAALGPVSTTPAAPVVTLQPLSQSVFTGATVTFTAAASGVPVPTVQWQISTDGGSTYTNIAGATSNTYSFVAGTSQTGDLFRAVFTNSKGTATSSAATLTITVNLPIVVNTTVDSLFPAGSPTVSLRSAIATANGRSVPTTITFDATVFATAKTITLNGTQLELSNTSSPITIVGPAARLTVSGNNASADFIVDASVTANISGLSIINGNGPSVGGIDNSGILTLTNVTLSGNNNGGMNNEAGGEVTVIGSTIMNNIVTGNGFGGDGFYNNGIAILTDDTIANNTMTGASDIGAGIENGVAGTLTLSDCTISGNSAPGGTGAGLYNIYGGGTITLENTIIAGNNVGSGSDPDVFGTVTSLGHNLIGATDGSTGWISTDLTGTASVPLKPLLGPLAFNGGPTETFLPLSGSPAIGHGSVTLIPAGTTLDQRGLPRVVGGKVDIGAVELQGASVAPVVTTQPVSQTVTGGNTVTFTAAASGTPTPTVQWQISTNNGATYTNIAGATSTTYSFAATLSQTGDLFRAVFTNAQGTATTSAAKLTVTTSLAAPVITTQPLSRSVTAGAAATFTATATGNPVPTVQWQISVNNGATYTNIAGATSTTYTFAASLSQTGDLFRAVFTNGQGTATTTAATLTVTPVLSSPVITTQPVSKSVVSGAIVTLTAAALGNPVPTVQWQFSSNGGSTYTNIAGATSTTFTFTATPAQNGHVYRAVFTNSQGSATTNGAVVTVATLSAPAVQTQPISQIVAIGGTVAFTAAATGNPVPTVQWQVSANGGATFTNIAGATSTTYGFAATAAQNGDLFRAIFTNSQGSATTAAATLTVSASTGSGSIAGNVFNDANGNGTFDAAESGMPFWVVYLDNNNNGQFDAGDVNALSAANGSYSFTNLAARTFTVREVLQSGYAQTAPSGGSYAVTITAAARNATGKNFGNKVLPGIGTISGIVFNDRNGDGLISPGEPGQSFWNVYLDKNKNGVFDAGDVSSITNAGGAYSFTNVPFGAYSIREVLQSGYSQTTPAGGGFSVTLSATTPKIVGKYFGNRLAPVKTSVIGSVFSDIHGNRKKDTHDEGL